MKLPWIEKGYRTFAYEGPTGLKVERMAREVGKNKSSFYHHFADLEVFTEELLSHHLNQAGIMAAKEAQCQSLKELIEVVLEHKIDLLFNRQIRIHRENKDFDACVLKTEEITAPAIMGIWSQVIGLEHNSYLAGLVLKLSIDNFYLQINDETLNEAWLNNYFAELKLLITTFKKSNDLGILDGSV